MDGIGIRKGEQEKRESRGLPAEPAFFLAGIFGLLLFLHSLDGVRVRSLAVYPFAVCLGGSLWFTWNRKKKCFYILLGLFLPAGALYVFLLRDTLRAQAEAFFDRLAAGTAGESADITCVAILFTAVLTIFLFLMEFVMEKHGVCLLLASLPLLLIPMLAVREDNAAAISGIRAARLACYPLLLLFQAAFQVIRHTGRGKRGRSFSGTGRLRLSVKGCAVLSGIFGAVLVIISIPVLLHEQFFYGLVYGVEGYLARTLQNATGMAQEANADGRISRGNNYRTGTVQLILETDTRPTQMLYLRGFGGGEYVGGDWIRSSDEALFEQMEERLDWGEWSYMIGGMYYSMYYVMNESVYLEDMPQSRTIHITHASGSYYNTYVPYYSQRGAGLLFSDREREGYSFRYYEQQDMRVGEGEVPESFETQMGWYRQVQAAYIKEAERAYTRVPVELLPRLAALVEENPLESLDEITAFILYTLQSSTSYTLTPGRAPVNEDVVEYFLFEGKRGYCVHYAAAATLMYRLYGIPARYASGYAVPPSAFVQTENGSWEAEATDEQAHAWVEIFLENYGWTPVEVTPSDSGVISASYPGFETGELEMLFAERGWDAGTPGLSENEAGEQGTDRDGGTPGDVTLRKWFSDFLKEHQMLLAAAAACPVYTLLLVPLFLDYRRLRTRKRMESADCRQIFGRLLQMLRFCGYMTEYDGTQEDFPEKLSEVCVLSPADAAKLRDIVERAAYGSRKPEDEEEEFVRKMYFRAAEQMYQGLSWEKRLVFRYVKAFG